MPHKGLSLSSTIVDELFPFHILLDESGSEVLSTGCGLIELLGMDATGHQFDHLFNISRPKMADLSMHSVNSHLRSSIILQARDTDVALRGQVLVSSESTVLFVGSVLVSSAETLQKHNVSLKLFSPFDLTPDIVILHKFMEMENRDRLNNNKQLLEMSKSRDKMSQYANTDELTKLANRRGFWQAGERILHEHQNNQTARLLLALLDLDDFKTINDQFGHETGDAVICETADRLQTVVGSRGLVARLGGDEFVIILILDLHQDPNQRAQHVLNAVNGPFKYARRQLSIVASIGVTKIEIEDTLEGAIHHADIAMLEGRQKKQVAVSWYTEALAVQILEKKQMLRRLEKAIRLEQINPHFQPVLELPELKLTGFEALARWHDEELGMVRPDIFIELAEELGLLNQLDMLILDKSLNQLARWHKQGKNYAVHVNVSAASIQMSLVDHVMSALDSRGLSSEFLILELTETTLLENTDLTREVIGKLSDKGVSVQLDDFGTGYSSLSHIRNFPVAGIKIDRSFVVDAHIDSKSRTLLKSVVNIALNLNLDIVAEGIENQEQMDFLTNIGCKCAQGFYIGKPATADTCEQLFSQSTQRAA